MDGSSGIPFSWKKYAFPGLLLLVTALVLVLYQRLGGGSMMVISEALPGFGEPSENRWSQVGYEDSWHGEVAENVVENRHHHLPRVGRHSHLHDKEVHFVLHESALGAPEFIGRNDRKAIAVDFDASGTFLNAAGHAAADLFHADNYKEKNVAIGLAITTRQQTVNTTTLAKELPFFTVFVFFWCHKTMHWQHQLHQHQI